MAAAPKLFPSMETSQGNAYSFDYSEYDEAKTRNSLKTHNYNKNTANTTIINIHNAAIKNPSREAADQMEQAFEKFKRSGTACETAMIRLLELKVITDEAWDKDMAQLARQRSEAEKCAIKVYGLGRPLAQQPNKPNETCKAVDALKPQTLSTQTSPAAFALWKDKFRAYHNASKMQLATNEEQHQYMYVCMEDELYQRVRFKLDPKATPIFVDPGSNFKSAMEVLTDEFSGLFPLAMRRMEWVSHKYAGSWASYYSKMRQLASAADYRAMEADDYLAFTLMAGIPHCDMRTEMLRLETPTPEALDRIGREFDRAGAVQAHMSTAGTPKAMKAQQSGGGEKKKKAAAAGESSGFRKWKQLEEQGKCGRCAASDHVSSACAHKKSKCASCSKVGHTARACQQTAAAKTAEEKDNIPKLPMLGFEGGDNFTPRAKAVKAVVGQLKSRATPPLGL